jgi:hypothetical protein
VVKRSLSARLLVASALLVASLRAPLGLGTPDTTGSRNTPGSHDRPLVSDAHATSSHPGIVPEAAAQRQLTAPLSSFVLPVSPALVGSAALILLSLPRLTPRHCQLRIGPRGARSPPLA